jgi:predicted esterase
MTEVHQSSGRRSGIVSSGSVGRPDPHFGQQLAMESLVESVGEETLGLILVHGRGGDAGSFLDLGRELAVSFDEVSAGKGKDVVLVAPEAQNHSWYPGSFLLPLEHNEPWLSSGLAALTRSHQRLLEIGVARERQILVGFSQGACLASEFLARNPGRWGGLAAFTGGVQGPLEEVRSFPGELAGTPVFLTTGDPDPHVPLVRVEETARIFEQMGARVAMEKHSNRPHTVLRHEIRRAAEVLLQP